MIYVVVNRATIRFSWSCPLLLESNWVIKLQRHETHICFYCPFNSDYISYLLTNYLIICIIHSSITSVGFINILSFNIISIFSHTLTPNLLRWRTSDWVWTLASRNSNQTLPNSIFWWVWEKLPVRHKGKAKCVARTNAFILKLEVQRNFNSNCSHMFFLKYLPRTQYRFDIDFFPAIRLFVIQRILVLPS